MAMRVEYHRKAFRQLETIARGDRNSARAIADAIDKLEGEPRPHGCETLEDEILRIRVRDYRVIYGLDEKEKRVVIFEDRAAQRSHLPGVGKTGKEIQANG